MFPAEIEPENGNYLMYAKKVYVLFPGGRFLQGNLSWTLGFKLDANLSQIKMQESFSHNSTVFWTSPIWFLTPHIQTSIQLS